MDAIETRAKHESIRKLVDILKSYIIALSKYNSEMEYQHEISYIKEIIKGLLIDDALGDTLSKPFSKGAFSRPIFSVLYKEHIKPFDGSVIDMHYIEQLCIKLYDKKHELRNNLFYMDSYPEVKLIQDMVKIPWPHSNKVDSAIRNIRREMKHIDRDIKEQD